MIGIYKITSPKGRVYIGQTTNFHERMSHYRRLWCKKQPRLYKSLLKYGVDAHKMEMIARCDMSELNNLERYYQELYNAIGRNGLNCVLVSCETDKQRVRQESRDKMSKTRTGVPKSQSAIDKLKIFYQTHKPPNYGKKASEELKEKIRLAIAPSLKRRTEERTGKKIHDAESREKIRAARLRQKCPKTGKKWTDEIRNRILINSNYGKLVVNLESGIYYHSAKAASEAHGYKKDYLLKRLSGHTPNNTSLRYT